MKYPGRIIAIGEVEREILAAIRQRLRNSNIDVPSPEGAFDLPLARAVKLFQIRHVDYRGRNLVVDGRVGPLTWDALFGTVPKAISQAGGELAGRAIDHARTYLGVREHPRNSNRGPEVDRFLRSVRLDPGHAWCAAFVHWCLQQAAQELERENPCLCHGGVLRQWQHAIDRRVHRVSASAARNDPTLVQPGMVFVMASGGGLGHTGFVVRVQGSHLDTIEGNTDASRTREGGGVYALSRTVGEINKGYVLYG